MHILSLGLAVLLAIAAFVFVTVAVTTYNALVSLRYQVDRAWANIDVVLKQRHDVVPQLLSVCEQFTQYERGTFDRIIEARKAYGGAVSINDKIKASAEMTQALRGVFALGEAYPTLKSSEQFTELEKAIKDLEIQIADRRELYNETVTNFNTRCLQFPDMVFAGLLHYTPLSLYQVNESDKAAPRLDMKLPA